jgi:hypothetical protein
VCVCVCVCVCGQGAPEKGEALASLSLFARVCLCVRVCVRACVFMYVCAYAHIYAHKCAYGGGGGTHRHTQVVNSGKLIIFFQSKDAYINVYCPERDLNKCILSGTLPE